jgi:hypothetical protein
MAVSEALGERRSVRGDSCTFIPEDNPEALVKLLHSVL